MLSQFHAFSNLSCIHFWIVPSSHISPYPIAPYQPCQGVAKTWGGGVSSIIVPLLLQLVFVAPSSIPQVNLIRVGWWSFQTGPNSRHSTVCQHFVSIHFREDWRCFIYSFQRTTMVAARNATSSDMKHRMIITKNSPNLAKKYTLCEYKYIWNMFAFSQCSSMKSRRQTYFEKWKGEEEMQN